MGQRHQIYVRISDYDNQKHVIGIHHQWLYGRFAAFQAGRFLKMATQASENESLYNNMFQDPSHALQILLSMYAVVPEKVYFHPVWELEKEETENPRCADNNDGITIYDLADRENIGYCFMGLGNRNASTDLSYKNSLVPISAEKYIRQYYGTKEQIAATKKDISSIIKTTKKFRLLTLAEVKTIFPLMYSGSKIAV